MANLIVYFTKKLLDNNAIIFNDAHDGFFKDI